MDGGTEPIRDGDWMLFRWSRGAALSDVEGRVACIERGEHEHSTLHVKRIVLRDGAVQSRSGSPSHPSAPAEHGDLPIAVLRRVIRPEDLAPERLAAGTLPELFAWVEEAGSPGWARHGGHLFLLLDQPGQARSPREVQQFVPRHAAETAYVCHAIEGGWRYLGVGRTSDGSSWTVPEMDFRAWTTLRKDGTPQ